MRAYNRNMTLDQALAARMKERRLTKQIDAAPVLGVPQSQLSKWLRLVDVPGDQYAPAIAKFLGISADETILLLSRTRAAKATMSRLNEEVRRLQAEVTRLNAENAELRSQR